MMYQDLVERSLLASTAISQDQHYPKLNQLLNQTSDHSKICNSHLVTEKAILMPLINQASMVVLQAVCLNSTNVQHQPRLQIYCKFLILIIILR